MTSWREYIGRQFDIRVDRLPLETPRKHDRYRLSIHAPDPSTGDRPLRELATRRVWRSRSRISSRPRSPGLPSSGSLAVSTGHSSNNWSAFWRRSPGNGGTELPWSDRLYERGGCIPAGPLARGANQADGLTLDDWVMFYAWCAFLLRFSNDLESDQVRASFNDWIWVVRNLASNSDIDRNERLVAALRGSGSSR